MFISAFWLALSAMVVPSVKDAADFFAVKMDLEQLWHHGGQIAATVNLWIEPNSQVIKCSVGRFLGDEATAKSFCSLFLGRRVTFPRDSQGQKTYAFLSVPVFADVRGSDGDFKKLIQQFEHLPIAGDADAEIAVPDVSVPAGKILGFNVDYGIEVEVAPDGSVTDCQKRDRTPQDIAKRACNLAKAKVFMIRYSTLQQPVSYVRNVRIVPQASK
jgi:hypothetical protein